MKLIPLTNRPGEYCKIDDDDYDFISRFSWYAKKSRCGWYAAASVRVKNKILTFRMHRLIMRCFTDDTVDHLNRDHYDNRKENLEIVPMMENVNRYYDEVPF
jgi:hypothetical protein